MRTVHLVLGRERLVEADESALPALQALCRALGVRCFWDELEATLYIESPALGRRLRLTPGDMDAELSLQVVALLAQSLERVGASVAVTPRIDAQLQVAVSAAESDAGENLPAQIADGLYEGLVRFFLTPAAPETEAPHEPTVTAATPDPEVRLVLYPDPVTCREDLSAETLPADTPPALDEDEPAELLARVHWTARMVPTPPAANASAPPPPPPPAAIASVSPAPRGASMAPVTSPATSVRSRHTPGFDPRRPPGAHDVVTFRQASAPLPAPVIPAAPEPALPPAPPAPAVAAAPPVQAAPPAPPAFVPPPPPAPPAATAQRPPRPVVVQQSGLGTVIRLP